MLPGTVTYDNSEGYTLTFRSDESHNLREKFLQVQADTFDDEDSTGNYFMPTADAVIDLVLLNKELDRVAQYQLVGCSIRNVGPTGTGEVVTFTATVAYHYFRKTA